MKKKRYLTESEAKFLGFEKLNKVQKGKNLAPYTITIEQYNDAKLHTLNSRKRELKEVVVKKDKNGNVTSTVERLQSKPIDVPEGFEVTQVSTNKTSGIQWVQSRPIKAVNNFSNSVGFEEVKNLLKKEIKRKYAYTKSVSNTSLEGALKWADLHLGAHIENILNVDDYNPKILRENLIKSVKKTNVFGFKKTHVHIHGDIIESFSGLNHVNSWQSMDKNLIGAKVIKTAVEILHSALKEIKNLGKIKIVAGNHDRISKSNDEDVKGDAANLIAWGLELMGYDVEFHPYVITHKIDGINHIILHGDKGISKSSTSELILNYGIQGVYNYISEAHLHYIIEKLTVSQRKNFKMVKDDNILSTRRNLTSFMPGNFYSASNDWSTNTGYTLIYDNGDGRPETLLSSF